MFRKNHASYLFLVRPTLLPDNGSSMFLRNVSEVLPRCTASHLDSCYENCKSSRKVHTWKQICWLYWQPPRLSTACISERGLCFQEHNDSIYNTEPFRNIYCFIWPNVACRQNIYCFLETHFILWQCSEAINWQHHRCFVQMIVTFYTDTQPNYCFTIHCGDSGCKSCDTRDRKNGKGHAKPTACYVTLVHDIYLGPEQYSLAWIFMSECVVSR
jgi:hypothetical protein